MFCPKCGTKNIDEAKFCVACGNPLPAVAAETAPPSGKTGNPAVAPDMELGVAAAPQSANVQPASKAGGKKKLPFIIGGAAAGVIALVLIAVFVAIPTFNKNPFVGCQVGDKVKFGSYEQDGDILNGKEPIEWRVLAVEGDRAYVVSQKALDAHAFNEDADDGNDWNSSDLKAWLEDDFASQAFTGDEMREIDGAPTLLSADEVNEYFHSDVYRMCMPTQQALNNGAWTMEGGIYGSTCCWWLRSPGDESYLAANVGLVGDVYSDGDYVDRSDYAVRPALWINL